MSGFTTGGRASRARAPARRFLPDRGQPIRSVAVGRHDEGPRPSRSIAKGGRRPRATCHRGRRESCTPLGLWRTAAQFDEYFSAAGEVSTCRSTCDWQTAFAAPCSTVCAASPAGTPSARPSRGRRKTERRTRRGSACSRNPPNRGALSPGRPQRWRDRWYLGGTEVKSALLTMEAGA